MKKVFGVLLGFFFGAMIFSISSCASQNPRPMSVTDTSKRAWSIFEAANTAIEKNLLKKALTDLETAYKLAVSIDENELECKILLSAMTREILEKEHGEDWRSERDEYFLSSDLDELLENAREAANRCGNSKTLGAICNVYEARKFLFQKANTDSIPRLLDSAKDELKKEPFYLAYLNRTYGEYFLFIKSEQKAKKCFETSASLHIQERYLAQISLDYYFLAQCETRLGNKKNALIAIENALRYDKLSENSAGIASDYFAKSKILLKGNPTEQEKTEAEYCIQRAELILKAGRK